MEGPEGFKENATGAVRREIVNFNVYLQEITTHKSEEDLGGDTIKVVEVEDVDQDVKVPAMDVV